MGKSGRKQPSGVRKSSAEKFAKRPRAPLRSSETPTVAVSPQGRFPSRSIADSKTVDKPAIFVATLTGNQIAVPSYKMSDETRKQALELIAKLGRATVLDSFVDQLETHISIYQVYKAQDKGTLRSERKALVQLKRASKSAKELIDAYQKACEYLPGRMRVNTAWGLQRAARPTHFRGIPIKYSDEPELLRNRETHLSEFGEMLSYAATIPRVGSPKGGRPNSPRAKDFVAYFQQIAKANLPAPTPSIRRGPLKNLLELSIREVGWHTSDIRFLLNPTEKPIPRKKPTS